VVLEASRRQPDPAGDVVVEAPVLDRGDYLIRLTDRTDNDNHANRSERSLTFRATFKGEENDAEPNDTARQAASLEPGETITENVFPGGDADWYRVPVESDATLDILLDDVPSGIRPVVEVHRAPLSGKAVKVLYLAGHADAALDQQAWGPAPVSFTRVDAGAPEAATVLQRLAGYDVVILDGLSDVSHFGMDRSESPGRIEAFAKAGGRFLLLAPRNLSMSLLAKASGASSEGSSESRTASSASALRLTDGEWQPKSSSGAWGNYYRQKTFPHWFVFRLGDTGATITRHRMKNAGPNNWRYKSPTRTARKPSARSASSNAARSTTARSSSSPPPRPASSNCSSTPITAIPTTRRLERWNSTAPDEPKGCWVCASSHNTTAAVSSWPPTPSTGSPSRPKTRPKRACGPDDAACSTTGWERGSSRCGWTRRSRKTWP